MGIVDFVTVDKPDLFISQPPKTTVHKMGFFEQSSARK